MIFVCFSGIFIVFCGFCGTVRNARCENLQNSMSKMNLTVSSWRIMHKCFKSYRIPIEMHLKQA